MLTAGQIKRNPEDAAHYIAQLLAENGRLQESSRPRPLSEWTEADGVVLWWKFPVTEPPWVGVLPCDPHVAHNIGWPGYHTHWTPIVAPKMEEMLP